MAGIIQGVCVNDQPNTGLDRCPKSEGITRALILTDPNARYTYTEDGEVEFDILQFVGSNTVNRTYPITAIESKTVSGGDTVTSDFGAGFAAPVQLGQIVETYRLASSDCLMKELSKFNGRNMRVFRADGDNYIFGTVLSNPAGEEAFAGFLCKVFVREVPAQGNDIQALNLELYYSQNYENELKNKHAVKLKNTVPDGLVGVTLKSVTVGDATLWKVLSTCSLVDYTPTYADQWEANMFVQASGTPATAVVYDETNQALNITPTGVYTLAGYSILADGGIYDLNPGKS